MYYIETFERVPTANAKTSTFNKCYNEYTVLSVPNGLNYLQSNLIKNYTETVKR